MNTNLILHAATVEGRGLNYYVFRGRICVVAAEVGAVLGYADDGKKLVDVIRQEWNAEIIHGRDVDVFTGDDLRDFKGLGDTQERWVSSARLMVLYESGYDLVCLKTEKPVGRILRRVLADEVLPKLRRGEAVLPPRADPIAVLAGALSDAIRGGDHEAARRLNAALTPLLRGPARPRKTAAAPAGGEQLPLVPVAPSETEQRIEAWLVAQPEGAKVQMIDVLTGALGLTPLEAFTRKGVQREAGAALRRLGWRLGERPLPTRGRVWTRGLQ